MTTPVNLPAAWKFNSFHHEHWAFPVTPELLHGLLCVLIPSHHNQLAFQPRTLFFLFPQICSRRFHLTSRLRWLCIATGQCSSSCVSAVVLFLGGFDHMEDDDQDREQVDSERESRGAREKRTNAQTCDDMCVSDFVRHTLRHLEPQCDVCTRSNMSRKSLV